MNSTLKTIVILTLSIVLRSEGVVLPTQKARVCNTLATKRHPASGIWYLFLALTVGLGFSVSCSSHTELQWNQQEGYRWAEVETGYFGSTGFSRLSSSRTNVGFRNDVGRELMAENRHYLNGSGVAVADVDGDGLTDIYFARLDGSNKLYRNLGGWRFEDITDRAGVAHQGYNSTGVAFADVNGDGAPDLLVTSLTEGNMLYLNDGDGYFTLMEDSGLGKKSRGAHTMALADINGDGYLDLYIANYKIRTARDLFSEEELALENTVEVVGGELRVLPPFDEYYTVIETADGPFRNEIGAPDELYLNRGDGSFERAGAKQYFFDADGQERGLTRDWGLTATFRDVNGDGHPDLYVANDFWTPDRFWINRGDGTFRAAPADALRNMSFSSMGVDFSDINRDGHLDFVVTEMLSQEHPIRMRQYSENQAEYEGRTMHNRNSVYLNRGDTTYAQIAWYSGLQASGWSWATYFMDVDLDGYEDLIVATGNAYDYQDVDTQIAMHEEASAGTMQQGRGNITRYPLLKMNNKIFNNNGDLTFTDRSREWGFDVEDLSMGMALADLDNDGDPDLIINRMNDEAAIYENRIRAPRIAVRLKGNGPNSQGIGAKITLEGGPVMQQKEMVAGGNYLSGSQAQAVFAADPGNEDHVIIVKWPGGKTSRIDGVKANRIYEIDESTAVTASQPSKGLKPLEGLITKPLFADVSDRINHTHHENDYDDYKFNPLLPQKLSRQGPGVAWLDVTGNGRADLLIGSGKGGQLGMFENRREGRFVPIESGLSLPAPGDQTAVIGWSENEKTRIVTGSANYEQGNPNVPSAYVYTVNTRQTAQSGQTGIPTNLQVERGTIPGVHSATGPLAAADIDGDGYVDLFVGGRFKPGQYPVNADSRLFRNEGGTFWLDETASRVLAGLGLVTGAVFSDLNQNGYPDLLLSTEWGPLRLFENTEGRFREITKQVGLDKWHGWWQGVTTGDFNNDGRPDIVATNMGLNSPYQVTGNRELRLYYEDINRDGRLDIIDSYYDEVVGSYVPRRKMYEFGTIPTILNQISTHREFARSSIGQIFNRDFNRIPHKKINTLEHMVFLNTENGFEARPLPGESQFTAGFHVGVADVDNDGNEDLFLSQNFFGFPKTIPRQDAGRGLLLKGDGKGSFIPVDGMKNGIKIYGEQRGSAFGDFDGNGKVDLVVTQNNGETKLYLNETDHPGLRVRLAGPAPNRDAIGSSIRVAYRDGSKGPRREIRAGSGYWSQDSPTQVMGLQGEPSAIEVRWFDGSTETVEIPEGDAEIVIRYSVNP